MRSVGKTQNTYYAVFQFCQSQLSCTRIPSATQATFRVITRLCIRQNMNRWVSLNTNT